MGRSWTPILSATDFKQDSKVEAYELITIKAEELL